MSHLSRQMKLFLFSKLLFLNMLSFNCWCWSHHTSFLRKLSGTHTSLLSKRCLILLQFSVCDGQCCIFLFIYFFFWEVDGTFSLVTIIHISFQRYKICHRWQGWHLVEQEIIRSPFENKVSIVTKKSCWSKKKIAWLLLVADKVVIMHLWKIKELQSSMSKFHYHHT